jgi:D-alanine-D-alanine ligase
VEMRLNVGIVFGGQSVEHEISIISALQMIENMNKLLYNPIPIYLTKDNKYMYHEEMINIDFFKNNNHVLKNAREVIFKNNKNKHELLQVKGSRLKKLTELDVIFLVVHGTNCEDGTLSAYFDLLNIPYVGSNQLSSSISQNKKMTKLILEQYKIPIVEFVSFNEEDYLLDKEESLKRSKELGFPLVVKPVSLGSSVGISKCNDLDNLKDSISNAFQYDKEVIVEKGINNLREFNCSVLGNCYSNETSVVEEVKQTDQILSYTDKYLRGEEGKTKGIVNTNRIIPAEISKELSDEIKKLASKVFKVIGNSGVSRIDFLYDEQNKKLYVNEINTIPGSLSYYLWQKTELDYPDLINKLIEIALVNYRVKSNKIYTYDTNVLSMTKLGMKGKLK